MAFRRTPYEFGGELYRLTGDADERRSVAPNPEYRAVRRALVVRLDRQFERCADLKRDLWKSGRVKSNPIRRFLWRAVWGAGWRPAF